MKKFLCTELGIIINKGRNSSHTSDVNLLAGRRKLWLFDNHLCAYWCWSQLDLSGQLNLLHIDRHYDLAKYVPADADLLKVDCKTTPLAGLTGIRKKTSMGDLQILRWDNYINLFLEKNPVITFAYFITQKDGELNFKPEHREVEVYDIFELEINGKDQWIINIDIDYFFTKPDGQHAIRLYTDEFIHAFGRWLSKKEVAAALITICLSPECCGGWRNAIKVANILGEYLDFHLS